MGSTEAFKTEQTPFKMGSQAFAPDRPALAPVPFAIGLIPPAHIALAAAATRLKAAAMTVFAVIAWLASAKRYLRGPAVTISPFIRGQRSQCHEVTPAS
jgi:hypothetical protein